MRPLSSRTALKIRGNSRYRNCRKILAAKAVQGPALPLQSVYNVHGCDSLPLGMLGVGHGIADEILKEHLQDTPGLFIHEPADPLDPSSPRQSSDGWLGDSLDVVPQDLAMPLGAALSETLASFAAASHSFWAE